MTYYTPTLEEFHVGFECEYNVVLYKWDGRSETRYNPDIINNNNWQKAICVIENIEWAEHDNKELRVAYDSTKPFLSINPFETPLEYFRVKYLDESDLIELGFKLIWNEHKPYGNYFKGNIGTTEIWYAKLKNKIPYIKITSRGNLPINIKNISELKRLMKQLNIL